jgi:hypothetical protein
VGSLGLGAQEGDPISRPALRELTARILAIDPDTLALTLDAGEPDDLFHGGPAERPLIALLAIGDLVRARFYESRVVRITPGTGGGLPEGVRPGQSVAVRPALRDGTVTAVDPLVPSITVLLDTGIERTFGVIHRSLLSGVEVGDVVTLTVTLPLLTDVERLP